MKSITFLLYLLTTLCLSCSNDEMREPDTSYQPEIIPANFSNSTQLTHTYFQFEPGKKYIYESATEDGLERTEVQRRSSTRNVMGITCVVVNDKVFLDGILIEDTDDWYAQDDLGNVWYMGEAVDNYNDDGSFKDNGGAWEAGVDGAQPGIVMPADPQPGMTYRQEYYFNEAEDQAEITQLDLTISVPYGTFDNCLMTHEWTELEPDVNENKFYAPGIGFIKAVNVTDNEEEVLVDIEN